MVNILPLLSLAFVSGIITSFQPCLFPLLPTYFSYMNSYKKQKISVQEGLLVSIFLTIGILVVFLTLAFLVKIGQLWLSPILIGNLVNFNLIMAIVLIILGVLMLSGIELTIFYRVPGISSFIIQENPENKLIASFLLGLAYTAIAAPCAAPIFLSIVTQIVFLDPISILLIMSLYSIGCGIPFLAIGLAYPSFNEEIKENYSSVAKYIKPFSGVILLLMSFYLLNNFVLPYYSITIGNYSFRGFNTNLVSNIYIGLFILGIFLLIIIAIYLTFNLKRKNAKIKS